jgi:membrane protein implicated in regulation of membrane protease activity
MMLAVCIALAIALYLDPDWNVVPFPWNGISFLVLVGVAILIHRRTRPFRIARKMR